MRLSWLRHLLERSANARVAAVARIGIGIAAILKGIEVGSALFGFEEPGVLRLPLVAGLPTLVDLPAWLVTAAWMLAASAFTLGFRTPWAGAALAAIMGGTLLSDQQLYSNHLYLLTLLVALLTLGRAASTLSLDARMGPRQDQIPDWPLQLIRIQISIVYLFAALSKINPLYLSGSVVAATLRSEGPLAFPAEWRTFEVMATFSLLAILAEGFIAIALWLPRWRRAAFLVGLGVHLSIAIWFSPTGPLIVFGLIILTPYVLFIDASVRARAVVWDDSCGFCTTSVRLLRRLDWLHALRFVPGSAYADLAALGVSRTDADRALQLVGPRRRQSGFAAIVGILEVTPLAFLWAPLLRLWPISRVGDWAYRRVAARRRCTLVHRSAT